MPDISMCTNKKCEKKHQCYRYMAKPSWRQSYSAFENSCKPDKRKMFFKIDDSLKLDPLKILEKNGGKYE